MLLTVCQTSMQAGNLKKRSRFVELWERLFKNAWRQVHRGDKFSFWSFKVLRLLVLSDRRLRVPVYTASVAMGRVMQSLSILNDWMIFRLIQFGATEGELWSLTWRPPVEKQFARERSDTVVHVVCAKKQAVLSGRGSARIGWGTQAENSLSSSGKVICSQARALWPQLRITQS